MKKIIPTIFMMFFFLSLCAQDSYESIQLYRADSSAVKAFDLEGGKIKILNDGDYILVIDSFSHHKYSTLRHPLIQKVDSTTGKVLWSVTKMLNGRSIKDLFIDEEHIYLLGSSAKSTTPLIRKYQRTETRTLIWMAKYDLLGNEIWTKEYAFKLDNDGYGITSNNNGKFYVLGKVGKRKRKLRIRFRNNIRSWVKISKSKVDKLVILEIDEAGEVESNNYFGKWEKRAYYTPTSIAVNKNDEICFTTNLSMNCSGCTKHNFDSWVVKLDDKKRILKNHLLESVYLEKTLVDEQNAFNLIGKNSSHAHYEKDSIFIYSIDTLNTLSQSYCFESKLDLLFLRTAKFDKKINTYYLGGWAYENRIKGERWNNNLDRNNWIASISIDDNKFNEWTLDRVALDRINDLDITEEYIIAIGDSWYKKLYDKKSKSMSLIKISK